ncbi:MAG: FAD-dependent oxidoreductase [Candidatus Acidiferrales bacterium]
MKPVDVLIVGGGPAGLATAIAASRRGLSVAVVDYARPLIDKTCGEGLLPAAVSALGDLGIPIGSLPSFPFKGIRFTDQRSSVEERFAGRAGLGVRRRELHRLLIERAKAIGVTLWWGVRPSGIETRGTWLDGVFLPCRWLVGADGSQSEVRKLAGLGSTWRPRTRFGFRRHFARRPWSDMVEVCWGDHAQLFITPTGAEEVCVVVLTSDPRFRLDRALEYFPRIASRLRGAPAVTRETGAATFASRARRVARGNIALVGDASCSVDAISGQGLSLAFQEALALTDAMAQENLAAYQAAHARITRNPVRVARLLTMMDACTPLRRSVLRIWSRYPSPFSKLTSVHAGSADIPPRGEMISRQGDDAAKLDGGVCEPG